MRLSLIDEAVEINLPTTDAAQSTELDGEQPKKKYKGQQAPERGFSFLKDPGFFAHSVFLKSPHRTPLSHLAHFSLFVKFYVKKDVTNG